MKHKLVLIQAMLLLGFYCQAQNTPSIDAVIGFGIPESIHAGIKVHAFKKSQFGLYYGNGSSISTNKYYRSITFDHQYHFGKTTAKSSRPVWFFRQGVSYADDNIDEYAHYKYWFVDVSLGREFSLTPKLTLSGDIGVCKVIDETKTIKDLDKAPWIDLPLEDFAVLPLIRVQLSYSLWK